MNCTSRRATAWFKKTLFIENILIQSTLIKSQNNQSIITASGWFTFTGASLPGAKDLPLVSTVVR